MGLYNCGICNFNTKLKSNYNRHLKTKKHITKENNYALEMANNAIIPHSHHKIPHSHHIIPHKTTQIPHHKDKELFKCEYCNKDFSRIDSLNRHISKFCKKKQELDKSLNENMNLKQIIKKQTKQIEKLLEKSTGPINNTQNNDHSTNKTINNIQINNYGEENLEMLTDDFKVNCVLHPCLALINIVEKIHFNDDYPENKNIRILNKRDNKIQIRSDGKWCYHNKDNAIRYTLEDCNDKLEKFYEEKKDQFRKLIRMSCREIIKNVHQSEEEFLKQMHNKMELILFNN